MPYQLENFINLRKKWVGLKSQQKTDDKILQGNVHSQLNEIKDESIDCVVTSPHIGV